MIKKLFWSQIVIFFGVLFLVFSQLLFPLAAILGFVLFILGILIIIQANKTLVNKKLKRILIIFGVSSSGILLCALLHNIFYAFSIGLQGIRAASLIMEYLHVTFFILGTVALPISFLISAFVCIYKFRDDL